MHIVLKRSQQCLLLLLLLHTFVFCFILMTSLSWGFQITLCLLVMLSLSQQVFRLYFREIVAFHWDPIAETWFLKTAQGASIRAQLKHNSTLTSGLSVLNFYCDNVRMTRALVLFPDRLSSEAYRQLRVFILTRK